MKIQQVIPSYGQHHKDCNKMKKNNNNNNKNQQQQQQQQFPSNNHVLRFNVSNYYNAWNIKMRPSHREEVNIPGL